MELTVVKNATCTFCGCVCDDIELHADAERIVETKRACILGEAWFKNHTAERLYPDALIDGREATVDEAVEAAAEFLHAADMPLIYGLSNVTCETTREAVQAENQAAMMVVRDNRQSLNQAIRACLTPEQQKEFDAWLAELAAQRPQRPGAIQKT